MYHVIVYKDTNIIFVPADGDETRLYMMVKSFTLQETIYTCDNIASQARHADRTLDKDLKHMLVMCKGNSCHR